MHSFISFLVPSFYSEVSWGCQEIRKLLLKTSNNITTCFPWSLISLLLRKVIYSYAMISDNVKNENLRESHVWKQSACEETEAIKCFSPSCAVVSARTKCLSIVQAPCTLPLAPGCFSCWTDGCSYTLHHFWEKNHQACYGMLITCQTLLCKIPSWFHLLWIFFQKHLTLTCSLSVGTMDEPKRVSVLKELEVCVCICAEGEGEKWKNTK